MRKKIFSAFVILISLFCINISISAQTVEEDFESKSELYKVISPIEIDGLLSIDTGTLLYGNYENDTQQLSIKFNNNSILLPFESFELVDTNNLDNIPNFLEVSEEILTESINLNPSNYFESEIVSNQITIIQEFDSKVYLNQDEKYILVGNVKYVVNNSDSISEESTKTELKEESSVDTSNVNTDTTSDSDSQNKLEIDESSNSEVTKTEEDLVTTFSVETNMIDFSTGFFKVNDDSVPVYDYRSNPRLKVGELKKGQEYKIIGDSGNWHKIQFGTFEGYVWKSSTIPSTGQETINFNQNLKNSNLSFVTKGDLIVYDNTSGSLVPFGVINEGVEYPVVSDTGSWLQVLFGDRIGFVYESNVEIKLEFANTGFFKVKDNSVPVYDYRSNPRIKVGELKKGQEYKIIGDSGNWHKIQFGTFEGYVWKDSTIPSTGKEIKNLNGNYQNSSLSFKTKGNLIVYDNTSGSLEPFGVITEGVKYPVVSDTGDWLRVLFGDRVGYVYERSVEMGFKETDRSFKVTSNNVPVYHNINGILEKVGYLVENQAYMRQGSKGNWHIIEFGDSPGFVWMDSTKPDSARSVNNFNPGYTNSDNNYIAQGDLVIRDKSDNMEIFARISEGTVFPIVKRAGSWYEVLVGGRLGYVYYSGLALHKVEYRYYNVSLAEAIERQMKFNPQTDNYTHAYVHKDWISGFSGSYPFNGTVTADSLHVRDIPNGNSYGLLPINSTVQVVGISSMDSEWYKIINPLKSKSQFVNADKDLVTYYMNPLNFINDEVQKFQFLELDKFTNTSVLELGKLLEGKGYLDGKASVFSNAASKVGINEIYLISHSLLETGNGDSVLASGVGVVVLKDNKGNPIVENGKTKIRLTNNNETPDEIVYNLFGIGAYDNCAVKCGAEYAYNAGWTTIDKAVVGGAEFISSDYIRNSYYQQNTLYEMKWNPRYFSGEISSPHQYASDIGWAYKQVRNVYNLYNKLDVFNLYLDIPKYK